MYLIPGNNVTYNEKGAKQVNFASKEEKWCRAFPRFTLSSPPSASIRQLSVASEQPRIRATNASGRPHIRTGQSIQTTHLSAPHFPKPHYHEDLRDVCISDGRHSGTRLRPQYLMAHIGSSRNNNTQHGPTDRTRATQQVHRMLGENYRQVEYQTCITFHYIYCTRKLDNHNYCSPLLVYI